MLAGVIEATDKSIALQTLRVVGDRVAALVAGIDNVDRPVPGLDWSVGDTATHLFIELRAYTEAVTGRVPGITAFVPDVEGYSRRMAAMTDGTLKAEPRRTAAELGGLVREQLSALVDVLEEHEGDEVLQTPWYGAGETVTVRTGISLQIGELLIHGLDIARGLGRPWPISSAEALQVLLPSTLEMMPLVADAKKVRNADGVYRVRLRGGPSIGVRFVDGTVDIAEWGVWNRRADVTLSADPVAFLLLGYGRKSQWPLIAQGRLFAYGRKPWLALQMRGLFVNP